MYDLFSNYDATEIIKKWKIKTYKLLAYIMFGVGVFLTIEFLVIAFFLSGEVEAALLWLLPFSFVFVVIGLVSLQQGNKIISGQKEVLEVTLFNTYQTEKTKIPIVKLTSNNKNNSEIAMLLLLDKDIIDIIRLNRNLKKIASYESKHTVFKFYVDTRKGQEKIKRKFFIESLNRNHKFYMMQDSDYKIMSHITSNGYYYEIYENGQLTKQYR